MIPAAIPSLVAQASDPWVDGLISFVVLGAATGGLVVLVPALFLWVAGRVAGGVSRTHLRFYRFGLVLSAAVGGTALLVSVVDVPSATAWWIDGRPLPFVEAALPFLSIGLWALATLGVGQVLGLRIGGVDRRYPGDSIELYGRAVATVAVLVVRYGTIVAAIVLAPPLLVGPLVAAVWLGYAAMRPATIEALNGTEAPPDDVAREFASVADRLGVSGVELLVLRVPDPDQTYVESAGLLPSNRAVYVTEPFLEAFEGDRRAFLFGHVLYRATGPCPLLANAARAGGFVAGGWAFALGLVGPLAAALVALGWTVVAIPLVKSVLTFRADRRASALVGDEAAREALVAYGNHFDVATDPRRWQFEIDGSPSIGARLYRLSD